MHDIPQGRHSSSFLLWLVCAMYGTQSVSKMWGWKHDQKGTTTWLHLFGALFLHFVSSIGDANLCSVCFTFLAPKNAVVSHARSEVDKKKLTITLDHGCRHVPRLFLNESVGIDKRGQVITTVPCTIDDHYVVTQFYFLFGS